MFNGGFLQSHATQPRITEYPDCRFAAVNEKHVKQYWMPGMQSVNYNPELELRGWAQLRQDERKKKGEVQAGFSVLHSEQAR